MLCGPEGSRNAARRLKLIAVALAIVERQSIAAELLTRQREDRRAVQTAAEQNDRRWLACFA